MLEFTAERLKALITKTAGSTSIAVLASLLLSSACLGQVPTGIFALAPGSAQNSFLIPQPNIAGQAIFVQWSTIDNGTALDWSSVETAIAPWWAAGKKTALILWAVSDNPSEIATPAYVLAQLPPTVNCNTVKNLPEFGATAFVSAYSNFLTAFFAKYGSDPRIAYIRVGIAIGGETYPSCTASQQATFGMTEASWTAYVDAILAVQQPLIGSVPAMVAFNCYGTPCPQSDPYTFPENVAALAAQYGMGIGKESLQQSDLTAWNSGQPCDANWCALFQEYPNQFHDLQFGEPTCANGNCPVGSPIQLLPFAAARGADVVEMLASTDLTIAYGPKPGPYTAAYQQAIANFLSMVSPRIRPARSGQNVKTGGLGVTNSKGSATDASPAQTLSTLHNFGGADGEAPEAALVQGVDGNLYGTTEYGGLNNNCEAGFGCGTIFKISPSGAFTTIYNFCSQTNCSDGDEPTAGLVQGIDGNFYGTTDYGGENFICGAGYGCGTIFNITPTGVLTTLHRFVDEHSHIPMPSGLVQATDGKFYGATARGGACTANQAGCGTVFSVTAGGKLKTLHKFDGTQGKTPFAGLVQGTNGKFYGTTDAGGTNGYGTVFSITPGGTLSSNVPFRVLP